MIYDMKRNQLNLENTPKRNLRLKLNLAFIAANFYIYSSFSIFKLSFKDSELFCRDNIHTTI